MFPEEFLHFVWQFQYFNASALQTTDGQPIVVGKQGMLNHDAGPDFREARIRVGDIEWHGHVEIHLKSSDWNHHRHQQDPAYDNVVLHVVWEADREAVRKDGTTIPQLELKDRVDLTLLSGYQRLVQQRTDVPCQTLRSKIQPIRLQSMLDRVLVERLQRKTKMVDNLLLKYGGDWDATAVHFLIKYFGFKKNEEGFQQLSQRVSYRIVQKLAFSREDLEAYLFGVAGLLEPDSEDAYAQDLRRRFEYINHKYQLVSSGLSKAQWKFMRMRPANFPTSRLAQLAAILHRHPRIFASFLEAEIPSLREIFKATVGDYWRLHYRFGEGAVTTKTKAQPHMGDSSIEILIINCVVPLLFAYGRQQSDSGLEEKAFGLLRSHKHEDNSITKKMAFLPVEQATAYESQACLELYQHYCQPRRCLACQVGVDLIRQAT